MALIEPSLFYETINKVDNAIKLLRIFEPKEGFYLAFSGGKDSIVVKDLCDRARVKYESNYECTTIDPPELMQFIRKYHPNTKWNYPIRPYFKELVNRGFPMREHRWCCEFLKEEGGEGRLVLTGIRAKESFRRRKRKKFEACSKSHKWFLHPILFWTEKDVWEYIKKESLPYCDLYDRGFSRIGCLLCPFASTERRIYESEKYTKITNAFKNAFNNLYEKGKHRESFKRWKSGEEMFSWWLKGKSTETDDDCPLFI